MSLIATLIEEFQAGLAATENAVPRSFMFPDIKDMIKVAIGMRRSGKTYFLYQHIHHLLKRGVPLSQILYINFEDDRLLPMDQKRMAELLESFYSLYPDNHQKLCYLFLDELQNIEGWELVVRRFLDTKKVDIYLTGSSAKLLSKEIATTLRGRSFALEIWPYNFNEYLLAHGIQKPVKPFGKMVLDNVNKQFNDFMDRGGFPAVQYMSDIVRRETLQNYVETVIFREVVERHDVLNIGLLKYLTSALLKNFSSLFSSNKFYNDIKSQGFQVGKDTIYNYIGYLEDAYLISTVPIFTESFRRGQTTSKKIYIIDNGLIQANIFSQHDNVGRLFENQVYLDLRRENKKIFYYQTKSGNEVDFLTQSLDGKQELVQVVWDMSDAKTKAREERALKEAEDELQIPGKIIDRYTYINLML